MASFNWHLPNVCTPTGYGCVATISKSLVMKYEGVNTKLVPKISRDRYELKRRKPFRSYSNDLFMDELRAAYSQYEKSGDEISQEVGAQQF